MKRSDLLVAPLFFILAICFLLPVTFGGRTLIPADNLFAFPPWRAYAEQFNAVIPHNELLSDLLLENYPWKKLITDSIQRREAPLWNPYLFTGVPFLAAGQHSALYLFSALFYLFPVETAFGWFVAIQLGIAGTAMYAFVRTLAIGRMGALVAALTYEFSGFFVVSVVFPMVVSAACWLPLLLMCEEQIIRRLRRADGARAVAVWVVAGAVLLAVSLLAGHVEIAYYNLLIMTFYGAWRILTAVREANALNAPSVQPLPVVLRQVSVAVGVLGLMVALGVALASVQIIPLYELVSRSSRQSSQPYETIISYAYPIRQIATFFIPDFFGNPSHHGYVDWWTRDYVPITQDANGNPIRTVFWGVKNYVEAGAYVGILPMLLALIAIAGRTTRRKADAESDTTDASRFTLLFSVLAVVSLAFVFGTPLYALLFYGLPGFSQLHSPFRWVYPFTLSIAVLAGIGAHRMEGIRRLQGIWAWAPIASGALILLTLEVSQILPAPFLSLAERFLRSSDLAQRAYPDARAFFSYEALNVLKFALFLFGAGIVIQMARRPVYLPSMLTRRFSRGASRLLQMPLWKPLAALVILGDIFLYGVGFYTSADPALLKFVPPAVKFLQEDKSLFRIASLDRAGEKVFNANVGMFYGLQDIRGYDSIIPKQYYDWMNLLEGQGELIYNRIAPFYWHGSLDSALLDLANVKYVLTTQVIPNAAKFTKVYAGEINIYRNERVMPRAFAVANVRPLKTVEELKSLDPSKEALIEGIDQPRAYSPCSGGQDVSILNYSPNEVVVRAVLGCAGWVVLADAYFDGWQAVDHYEAIGAQSAIPQELKIYRANGNFRAVELNEGRHTLYFRYNPPSFRLGLALSFFAMIALLSLVGYWAWGERGQATDGESVASRVLKNSALPMLAQLLNKGIDTVFTLFMLRILGVENAGKLATATLIIGYCDIVVNFGLSTLVTRDVSREHSLANRYLANTAIMRLLLILALAPPLALYLWASAQAADTALAIWLLFIGLVPSSVSASLSAIFYAREQMEYPAAVTVITTLMKVTVGVFVLLAGYGFVGLAGANILTNVATMMILLALFARKLFTPRVEFSMQFARALIRGSYPLMLNDMLSRMFNRVDMLILQQVKGNIPVGWYSTTYKYLEGINILPSTLTIALFPVLSRYAAGAPDALMRAYLKSVKYLVVIAMPVMALSFIYADFIMFVFGGEKFLPDSAIALQLIIAFLPFSFINNVTHYVLIAVNQQKFLTRTFVVGAAFNIVANLLLIPQFSYRASAVITILSELVLLTLFYVGVRAHVGKVNWIGLLWRPLLATGVMAAMIGGVGVWAAGWLGGWGFVVVVPVSLVSYIGALLATRTFDAEDLEMMKRIAPGRFRW